MTGVLLGRERGREKRGEEREGAGPCFDVFAVRGQCSPDNHKGQMKATDLLE